MKTKKIRIIIFVSLLIISLLITLKIIEEFKSQQVPIESHLVSAKQIINGQEVDMPIMNGCVTRIINNLTWRIC